MNLESYDILLTKINLKLIKDLNVSPEVIKLLKENIGEKFLNIALDNYFFNVTTVHITKATITNGAASN